MVTLFWCLGSATLGFSICVLLTAAKVKDLEDEIWKLVQENFNIKSGSLSSEGD